MSPASPSVREGILRSSSIGVERKSGEKRQLQQNLRRVSHLFKAKGPKEALRSALGDPSRDRFLQLCAENEELACEWKRICGFLAAMAEEYAGAKGLDPLRRYRRLQAIAKRIIFHMRLTTGGFSGALLTHPSTGSGVNEGGGNTLQSEVKRKQLKTKHETMCYGRCRSVFGLEYQSGSYVTRIKTSFSNKYMKQFMQRTVGCWSYFLQEITQ